MLEGQTVEAVGTEWHLPASLYFIADTVYPGSFLCVRGRVEVKCICRVE